MNEQDLEWKSNFLKLIFSETIPSVSEINDAHALKRKNLPKSIFKYREFNKNSIQNLCEDTIWLADPRTFNDPYDCHHYIDYENIFNELIDIEFLKGKLQKNELSEFSDKIRTVENKEEIQEILFDIILKNETEDYIRTTKATLKKSRDKEFSKIIDAGNNFFKNGTKLCSFSSRFDSPLMWAHYSSYHTGFCIEYDLNSLEDDNPILRNLYPVFYEELPFNLTESFIQVCKKLAFNNLRLNLASLIKDKVWSYEEEWRLVFSNGIVPEPRPCKMPLPKAVYLGSHITIENQKRIEEICGSKNIEIFKMKHRNEKFLMEPISILSQ